MIDRKFHRNFLSIKKSLVLRRIPYWLSFPEDETYIPCYHFYLSIPHSTDLYRCLHSSNCRTPGQFQTPFNIFRYNRRSRQNLSHLSKVQFCHSKAIFDLSFLISSQQKLSVPTFAIVTMCLIGNWKSLCKVPTNVLSFSTCLLSFQLFLD